MDGGHAQDKGAPVDEFLQGEDVEDLALRARVGDFLLDYIHAIDDGDVHAWPRFFAEDGNYKIVMRENFDAGLPMGVLYCDSAGMMRDRVLALETANIYEPHTYSHTLGGTRLKRASDGTLRARTNFNVTRTMQDGRMETFAVGKYLDRIVEQPDGGFLFAERLVVLESRRIDILLVYPL